MTAPRRLDAVDRGLDRLEADLGELLGRQQGLSLKSYEKWRDDLAGFVTERLHGKLTDGLRAVCASVAVNRKTLVRAGHATGKDYIGSAAGLWWPLTRGGLTLLSAPTRHQCHEIMMRRETRRHYKAAASPGKLYETALRLPGVENGGITTLVSNEPSNMSGFHHPKGVLLVLSEAQGVEDPETWNALLSNASGEHDRVLVLGNPIERDGPFWKYANSPDWNVIELSCLDHPNVVKGFEVIPGAVSKQWVEEMRREHGEESPTWIARVLGQFPTSGAENTLFDPADVERAFQLHESKAFIVASGNQRPVFAIDPARFGPDSTALCIKRGQRVERLEAWRLDTHKSADKLLEIAWADYGLSPDPTFLARWGGTYAPRIIVDEPGVGGGVIDALHAKAAQVIEFNGGAAPLTPDRFQNRRAEAHWDLRRALKDGLLALPRDEKLKQELCAVRWRLNPVSMKVEIEPKEKMKDRIGRSPDRMDSVILACWFDAERNYRTGRIFTVLM